MTLYLEVKSIFLVGVGQHVNTVVPKCTVLPQKCTELNNKAKYIYIYFFFSSYRARSHTIKNFSLFPKHNLADSIISNSHKFHMPVAILAYERKWG